MSWRKLTEDEYIQTGDLRWYPTHHSDPKFDPVRARPTAITTLSYTKVNRTKAKEWGREYWRYEPDTREETNDRKLEIEL